MDALLVRIALSAIATTLAAMAAERALRDAGRAGRAVWALALLFTATTTVVLITGGRLPLDGPRFLGSLLADPVIATQPMAWATTTTSSIDPLPYVWLALSLGLIVLLTIAFVRQRARLGAARVERVCDVDVVVTPALGPAVLGFLRPRIVVPDWLLERPDAERRLVIEHESEHIAARDPMLGAAALLLVCVVPWNPLLWYQLRRLRLAIELDCDARVLRGGDALAYGRLLVDVADRLARGTPLATALAFPRNFLEWRIRMITNRRTRPLRAAGWTLAAGVLIIAACADAGDPVAADGQETQLIVSDISEGEVRPLVLQADTIVFDSDDERVLLRELEPVSEFERRPDPNQLTPRIEDDAVGLVRFRATLNPDDTPATVEFDASVPADVQQRVREDIGTHQFRRSMADPNAPVQGVVHLD